MAIRRPDIGCMRTVLVIGKLLGGGVAAAIPAQAQGPYDFLDHLNSIGIGNRDDKHNFDLVGFGNVICWRLYGGETPGQITEMVITNSRWRFGTHPSTGRSRGGICHVRPMPGCSTGLGSPGMTTRLSTTVNEACSRTNRKCVRSTARAGSSVRGAAISSRPVTWGRFGR
jgi:hypothetical protein